MEMTRGKRYYERNVNVISGQLNRSGPYDVY